MNDIRLIPRNGFALLKDWLRESSHLVTLRPSKAIKTAGTLNEDTYRS
jgi:hypothetical protein